MPDLDFPALDINFNSKNGEMDQFFLHSEQCCYGEHVGLIREANKKPEWVQKCGWDAKFRDMPLHERMEEDPVTGVETEHRLRACPDEYNRPGNVTWMDFIKVSADCVTKHKILWLRIANCVCACVKKSGCPYSREHR